LDGSSLGKSLGRADGSIDCKLLRNVFGTEVGKCDGAALGKELGATDDVSVGS